LTSGRTTSCGCVRAKKCRDINYKHGAKGTKTYNIWKKIRQKCNDPNDVGYEKFGGAGIKVCERWGDYTNFLEDMGEVPFGMTLGRKDSEMDYCKENCLWVTREEMDNSRHNTIWLEHNGERRTLRQWAEIMGISRDVLYSRIYCRNWSVEKAFSTPTGSIKGPNREQMTDIEVAYSRVKSAVESGKLVKPEHCQYPGCDATKLQAHHHNGYDQEHQLDVVWLCSKHHTRSNELVITHDDKTMTLREWSEKTGVSRKTIYQRLKKSNGVVNDDTFAKELPRGRKKGGVSTAHAPKG
jgi:predicted DNA-binding transcriptional regulator AlpA